jgi:hypothetical protein
MSGFKIDETKTGLVIDIDSLSKLAAFQTIILSAKFPENGVAKAEVLLSPLVEQLVDVCREKLANEPFWLQGHRYSANDPFVALVVAVVEDYIEKHDLQSERKALLMRAFKPHTVDGLS